MDIFFNYFFYVLIGASGFFAAKLDSHLTPNNIDQPLLFNIGKLLSYSIFGLLLGLLGFLIKVSGLYGGVLLYIFAIGIIVITLSHLPIFPKIVIIGLQSHHHSNKPFLAGLTNIFASSPSLHIVMIVSLAHGYFFESSIIMILFVVGSIYTPKSNRFIKSFKLFQGIIFLLFGLFTLNKGLLYSEHYLFSPFENRKVAMIPQILDNQQFLKTDIEDLNYRFLAGRDLDLNWLLVGSKDEVVIYIPRFKYKSILKNGSDSISIKDNKKDFIYFTGRFGKGDHVIKYIHNIMDIYNLPYKKVLDSGYGDDPCATGENIDNIRPEIIISDPGIATLDGNRQEIEIIVTDRGYKPSVLILKKGVPAVINFIMKEDVIGNKRIVMPSYNEYLEFIVGENPINIPNPLIDFIFYSWQGEHGGYILIVDELEGMTKEKAERQIRMLNVNGI